MVKLGLYYVLWTKGWICFISNARIRFQEGKLLHVPHQRTYFKKTLSSETLTYQVDIFLIFSNPSYYSGLHGGIVFSQIIAWQLNISINGQWEESYEILVLV